MDFSGIKSAFRSSGRFGPFSSDLDTRAGLNGSITAGAAAVTYIAVSHMIGCLLALLADYELFGSLPDAYAKLGFFTVYGVAIVGPLTLGLLIWTRRSLGSAWAGLAWASAEVGFNATDPAN